MYEIGRRFRRKSWCLWKITILKFSKSRLPLVLSTHCTIFVNRSPKCSLKSLKLCKKHSILRSTWSKRLKRNLRRHLTKFWGIMIHTRWFNLLTIKLVHSRSGWATSDQTWETVSPNFSIKITRRFKKHWPERTSTTHSYRSSSKGTISVLERGFPGILGLK